MVESALAGAPWPGLCLGEQIVTVMANTCSRDGRLPPSRVAGCVGCHVVPRLALALLLCSGLSLCLARRPSLSVPLSQEEVLVGTAAHWRGATLASD